MSWDAWDNPDLQLELLEPRMVARVRVKMGMWSARAGERFEHLRRSMGQKFRHVRESEIAALRESLEATR